ncbi:MAG TPA: curlin repeat-containing protein [Terriglobales bacterium]|nr:curlin repeat-containing protein [Terriglobales bacterium]
MARVSDRLRNRAEQILCDVVSGAILLALSRFVENAHASGTSPAIARTVALGVFCLLLLMAVYVLIARRDSIIAPGERIARFGARSKIWTFGIAIAAGVAAGSTFLPTHEQDIRQSLIQNRATIDRLAERVKEMTLPKEDTSLAHVGIAAQVTATVQHPVIGPTPEEAKRRQIILSQLRNEYIRTHDASLGMSTGAEPLPKDWVNHRLGQMGEHWRLGDQSSLTSSEGQSPKPRAVRQAALPTIAQSGRNNIAQIGDNNSATINEAPPDRTLNESNLPAFAAAIAPFPGALKIFPAGISEDAEELIDQLFRVAKAAQWPRTAANMRIRPVHGILCYSDQWNSETGKTFKAAAEAAGLRCTYIDEAFSLGNGIEIGVNPDKVSITILVGRKQ